MSAVVTGGGSGIGLAISQSLKDNGYFVWDLSRTTGQRVDVTERGQVREFLKRNHPPAVWVNCAGQLDIKPWDQITDKDWDQMLNVNLRSVFICCQEYVEALKRNGQTDGCIINIASIGGEIGGTQAVHYATAKAGVISLTKSLARCLAPDIRVNAVSPGFIGTDMIKGLSVPDIPLGRIGKPEEVADAVIWLVQNTYVTGQIIRVNGGLLI